MGLHGRCCCLWRCGPLLRQLAPVGRFVALAHWKVACDVLKLSKDSYFNSLQICEGVIDAQSVTTEIREQITGKIRDYARG